MARAEGEEGNITWKEEVENLTRSGSEEETRLIHDTIKEGEGENETWNEEVKGLIMVKMG